MPIDVAAERLRARSQPVGSSSGSGAGVAASLAQVAIGTDHGSIVCSAGAGNGVVRNQAHPRFGLASGWCRSRPSRTDGGPDGSPRRRAALTLAVLQGPDPDDPPQVRSRPISRPSTPLIRARSPGRASACGAQSGLTGDRRHHGAGCGRPGRRRARRRSTFRCPSSMSSIRTSSRRCWPSSRRDVNEYLAETPGRHPADLAGLIEFNQTDPVELEFFGQELFDLAQDHRRPIPPTSRSVKRLPVRLAERSTRPWPATTSTRSWRRRTVPRG